MPHMNNFDATNIYEPDDEAATTAEFRQTIGRYRVESVLGQGGFGVVYLAHDLQLERRVAIKVPHDRVLQLAHGPAAYLNEARTLASLDHPNIVPVHDVGVTEDCPFFIVSKYIEGQSLAQVMRSQMLSYDASANLIAVIADALHYAHRRGLVHRDIKPGNILIDKREVPFVVDFGLALKESDIGRGPRFAGTPAYMSPEQARGESHRVDGRSDLFSVGVVLYEMLVGRRPFTADTSVELLEQITSFEARPPRQHNDAIPKELDRICLKLLSKRASERYSTALDLAEDLRHYLAQRSSAASLSENAPVSGAALPTTATVNSSSKMAQISAGVPLRVVPKGLRSFDAHDADFFLELLPGPRDRDGLPDSLRFWKTRIEEIDPQQTFTVGLICGPSGCGKSSFMKAALLPRLSKEIVTIYLEATAAETEARLLNGLRRHLPALSTQWGLKESLAAVRRGQVLAGDRKVLIILDQFEQWLHSHPNQQDVELVQALRQCDGGHLQCIVMVRDDFWMAVIRFMRQLEVRLVEGQNSAAIDLFPIAHAQRVLTAFGRAFGTLPESPTALTHEQRKFIERVVHDLAEDGKVICVRLALFAEMMKGKPWTPDVLTKAGGAEGIGVTFLEETFGPSASPEHRYHQRAARAVLQALLPESGTQIKGHLQSHQYLLQAAGYDRRSGDFDALIMILDAEIRLITPTDLEGKANAEQRPEQSGGGEKYYQLTHDYLVPALRDWLTRKQKETARGRAELLLADRASIWKARPENRQLPSFWQWLNIQRLTQRKNWSVTERQMMVQAKFVHLSRLLAVCSIVLLLGLAGRETYGRLVARTLRGRVLDATTAEVPAIVDEMIAYRKWVNPELNKAYRQAEIDQNDRHQLHASIALLPVDATQSEYLISRLLKGNPQDVAVIRQSLHAAHLNVADRLWAHVEKRQNPQGERFRAACALVTYAPEDARWKSISSDMASLLVAQKTFEIGQWVELFHGVGRWLLPPMVDFLIDENRTVKDRGLIATIYGAYAPAVPKAYRPLKQILEERNPSTATLNEKTVLAKKQASVGVALLALGQSEQFWPLLKHQPDPTMRTFLIDRLAPGGASPKVLLEQFGRETDASIRRAILLSLGEMGLDRWPPSERELSVPSLLKIYREDPDPGIHAASRFLLQQCQVIEPLVKIDRDLATGAIEGGRSWYVNRQGQTLVVFPRPGEVLVGQKNDVNYYPQHKHLFDRTFAIGAHEVTVAQFQRFRPDHVYVARLSSTPDCPMNKVTWFDAAAYCNWLSLQENIPPEQWCYEPNASGEFAPGMKTAPDFLHRTGYRLPTEWEWDYACRAGAETVFFFAEPEEACITKYVWYDANSNSRIYPIGLLKPNDFGLFDVHGNIFEWSGDLIDRVGEVDAHGVKHDREDSIAIVAEAKRVLRGGSFLRQTGTLRCTNRYPSIPGLANQFNQEYGIRVARTLKAD
ncbi:MAG: stkP 5 [Planctomycetaceae bacterium]|nr:stkP 5 [Planctomycetaceae bacterium]